MECLHENLSARPWVENLESQSPLAKVMSALNTLDTTYIFLADVEHYPDIPEFYDSLTKAEGVAGVQVDLLMSALFNIVRNMPDALAYVVDMSKVLADKLMREAVANGDTVALSLMLNRPLPEAQDDMPGVRETDG